MNITEAREALDNLFDSNAIPPEVLSVLGKFNRETGGSIEAHIYGRFIDRHSQLREALEYCNMSSPKNFDVKKFIDSFRYEAGLKRSLDRVYEIIVYALFSALAEAMNLHVKISVDESKSDLLREFEDFAEKVMRLNPSCPSHSEPAKIYRAGVTRLTQIGWRSHIQSIITENELVSWYDKALRGKYSAMTGEKLLSILSGEFAGEFPASKNIPDILKSRQYNNERSLIL